MAAQINTRVVVPLIVILAIVAGGAIGLAYYSSRRNPEYYKSKGDLAASAGDWHTAEEFYSKGVNRDQGNIELLDLWHDSIQHLVPVDSIEAIKYYQTASGIVKKKTESRPFEPQFHIDWLTRVLDASLPEVAPGDAALLAGQAEKMLQGKPASDDNPLWEQAYRFRGIANTFRMQEPGFTEQERDQALSDLQRWLASNPDDALAVSSLMKWHLFDARSLATKSMSREALGRIDAGMQFGSDFLSTHPDDVLVTKTLADALELRVAVERTLPGTASSADEKLREVVIRAESLALAEPDIPWWLSLQIASDLLWAESDVGKGLERALGLIGRSLQSQPDHPILRYEQARYLAMAGQREASRTAFQALIDAPNLPISRNSVRLFTFRPLAVIALFDMDLDQWRSTDPEATEARAAARAKAQSRIDQYRAMVSTSDAQLLYLEGRFALVDRQPAVAASRLNQFLSTVGRANLQANQRVQTLLDLAAALEQTNQPGAAYEFLAEAVTLTGSRNVPILRSLITLDLTLRNLDRAQAGLNRLMEIDPDSAETRLLRDRLSLARGGTETPVVEDEVFRAILKSREFQQADKLDEARAVLLKLRETEPDNLTVLYELARLEHVHGNTAEALKFTEIALTVDPKSDQWRIFRARLTDADLRPLLSQIVDEKAGLNEFEKHIAKWKLFTDFDFPSEAESEFKAAKSINPEAPSIIEEDFRVALFAEDTSAALNAVRRAQQSNADLANGLTFRGRYELQNGDAAAAISTLLQATKLKPYDGAVWRYLGVAYRDAGNYPAAMEALSTSLEKEPSSVVTLKELAKLQIGRQEYTKALETIRKAQRYAPGDSAIETAYLELEGLYGDRARVINTRERMLAAGAGGLENALALVQLYQLGDRANDAKSVLDSLKPEDPIERLRVAQAKAAWHRGQGELEEGRDALIAFTESTPPPERSLMLRAKLALARFYLDSDQAELAIEVAESAAEFQDPNQREADRSLGAIYLELRNADAALETFERAFVSTEESPTLGMQLVNLHLAVARRDAPTDAASAAEHRKRAEELLVAHEKVHGPSVEASLLKGELAFQQGDVTTAERVFNEAVASYPQDSRVYAGRARFNLTQVVQGGDIGRSNRVRADVEQAMQLNPTDADPLLTIADLAMARRDQQTGRPDPDVETLISTWRRILTINPRLDEIRTKLVDTLYAKAEYTQARLLLQEAIDLEPSRAAWYEIRGDLERQTGSPPEAYANYYGLAFEKQPSANRLTKLANVWLALTPPRAAQVVQMYERFEDEVGHLPGHRLLLARAHAALNDQGTALTLLREAATMILAEPDLEARDALVQEWHQTLEAIVAPGQYAATSEAAFSSLDDAWAQAVLGNVLYRASARPGIADGASLARAGLERMTSARDRVKTMPPGDERKIRLQREIGWNLGSAFYSSGEPAKAVEAWRWVLEVAPDHFATLNNLAYVLAHDLDQPEAALVPAKRAFETSPADPTMLDTYGYVLFRNGQLQEAERILRDSLNRQEQSSARMHLGEVLAAGGKTEDARRELNRARTLAEQQGNLQRVKDIDAILKGL